MSEVRFYLDEHVANAVATGLRRHGIDVLTVPAAGTIGADDDIHLALALSQQRVVFTQDSDFLSLAALGNPHAGIVYARQHTSISNIVRGLLLVHQAMTAEDMIGRISYL